MSLRHLIVSCLAMLALFANIATAQGKPYREEQMVPLADALKGVTAKPYQATNKYTARYISWPGDFATLYGAQTGTFKAEGIDVEFKLDNDLKRQCEEMLAGTLHFGRMTMGQAVQAAPAFASVGGLVQIGQLTFSAGGDTIVADKVIKTLEALEGKTVVMMLYGPHPEYLAKVLKDAEVDLTKVKIIWMKELLKVDPDDKGKFLSPYQAKEAAPKEIHAATLIITEAVEMKGSEGVEGTDILHTTANSPNITADCYFVRKDFFQANREVCWKFFMGMLKAQEAYKDFVDANNPKTDNTQTGRETKAYKDFMKVCATDILLLTKWEDADSGVFDCRFAMHGGNRTFFTGRDANDQMNFRNGRALANEIKDLFVLWGLVSKGEIPIGHAWEAGDFNKAAPLLKYPDRVTQVTFDAAKTKEFVEGLVKTETGNIDDLVSLTTREVSFDPDQKLFPVEKYHTIFRELAELAQTHSGTPIIVQGFADPSMIDFWRKKGLKSEADIKRAEETQSDLCLERAQNFIAAFVAWGKANNVAVNKSQFQPAAGGGERGRVNIERDVFPILEEAIGLYQAGNKQAAQKKLEEVKTKVAPCRVVVTRLQKTTTELSTIEDLLGGNK